MYTLALTALCIWLYGWYRTLALYLALIGTVVALILTATVSGLLSYMIWPTTVQQFHLPEMWTTAYTGSPDFTMMGAFLVPFIFIVDLFRIYFHILLHYPNIFFVLAAALVFYLWYKIWLCVYHVFRIQRLLGR